MIIVTAQQVRSGKKALGVNTYLYEVDGPAPRQEKSIDPLVFKGEDSESSGLRLINSDLEIPPGGNAVIAFLDFVFESGKGANEIDAVTPVITNMLSNNDKPPIVVSLPTVGAVFNAELGALSHASTLVVLLTEHCRDLLAKGPQNAGLEKGPLTIIVQNSGNRTSYILSEESRSAVAKRKKSDWHSPTISIDDDTQHDFNIFRGPFMSHIAVLLTDLKEEEILAVGGVQFVSEVDGKILGSWP